MSHRPIFTDFEPRHADLWGEHIVNLGHSLADSGLFSDDRLATLIERAPKNSYHVNTMDVTTHDPRTRREGVIDGLSGLDTLEAIKSGHIWILMQNPDRLDDDFRAMLSDIYAELEQRVPGFKSFKQKLSLLISSPNVQVYYHADVPGQTLWQVRGQKRVYVYPNKAPFLPQPGIEKIVLGEAHEISLPYEPWFDDHATVVDLTPGRMLHWPLNCPHRIVNADCLNVSFTTEHWTPSLRNAYAVNYANGILRSRLGLKALSQPQSGPALHARMALAGAWKFAGMQRKNERKFKIEFKVDPSAPHSVRDIEPYETAKH
ncbi:MAG: cupin-like domain-containing protein [Hyphomicrobiaceae bacterium]